MRIESYVFLFLETKFNLLKRGISLYQFFWGEYASRASVERTCAFMRTRSGSSCNVLPGLKAVDAVKRPFARCRVFFVLSRMYDTCFFFLRRCAAFCCLLLPALPFKPACVGFMDSLGCCSRAVPRYGGETYWGWISTNYWYNLVFNRVTGGTLFIAGRLSSRVLSGGVMSRDWWG